MAPRELFLKYLRDGLNYLYDPAALRQSPLAEVFNVANRFDTAAMLQNILTTAIEELRPKPNMPSYAANKRSYDTLTFRYLQQFSQQEVADQLGMSVRSLRRAQDTAIEALGLHLWKKYQLATRLPKEGIQPALQAEETSLEAFDWLKTAAFDKPASIARTLSEILPLLEPITQKHHVNLQIAELPLQTDLAIHPIALRHILLNLLNLAIVRVVNSEVRLGVRSLTNQAEINIRSSSPDLDDRLGPDEMASLKLVQRLVEMFSGTLSIENRSKMQSFLLNLPFLERIPVLVIDDNTDTLNLYERFVSDTHYHLVKINRPEGCIALAENIQPKVIVLDVMMTPIDGLEVLGRLRQHPAIGHIPIIVSTILAQEELVLSLGASAFLRKPVNRQDFLRALDEQVQRQGTESH
jgi:CheY-like chemotaxis protein